MREEDHEFLYKTFKKLKSRVRVPDSGAITKWSLERFIGNKTFVVFVNPNINSSLDRFQLEHKGLVSNSSFAMIALWN
ncbi:Fc.00g069290.m01.CDS01 [Cosmosporella sp. VM-42]